MYIYRIEAREKKPQILFQILRTSKRINLCTPMYMIEHIWYRASKPQITCSNPPEAFVHILTEFNF